MSTGPLAQDQLNFVWACTGKFKYSFRELNFVDVQRVINKGPLLFDNKTIEVERHYIEEDTADRGYDKCTIEVTGMSQTTPFNITLYFESRKGANSDVLSAEYVEEEEMYLVKFESEEGK
jgi:hypothetical protein